MSYLRDQKPGLSWAGHRDLPGGFREGDETPAECAIREVREETSLSLRPDDFHWHRLVDDDPEHHHRVYIFAARLTKAQTEAFVFGEEGGDWRFMPIADFIAHPKTIPWIGRLVERYLREYRA
ncbi:MAG: NUDIX domain-containing protein [Hyphomonadaceae bacterium]|nr:NUDIX domain-containing protein [Hyphomonadaceae bacterium]